MKKILTLVLASALGGIFAISAYTYFIETKTPENLNLTKDAKSPYFTTSNVHNTLFDMNSVPDFTLAASNTVHTVVHVKNTTISRAPLTLQDLFYGRNTERAQIGTGSGVIISPDGYIITNNHVIKDAQQISITLNNNKSYVAELIGTDSKTDIALLKIETDESLPYATFADSDEAKVGEWVLAVGNPFNLTSTVTAGIISAKARDLSGVNAQSFIQTDAAVNSGNSGGALVNANGELIGINTAITSQTGSYVGYSFAVPSNIARKVVEDIMEFGDVQKGILGVTGGELNGKTAEDLKVKDTEGFYIHDVEKESGAFKAGLKSGDIIKSIDHITISKFSDMTGYLTTKRPNDVVEVTIVRNGKTLTVPVTLSPIDILKVELLQMELKNIPDTIKSKLNIQYGAYISKNNNIEFSEKMGIDSGYIILGINNHPIKTVEDINTLKQQYGGNLEQKIFKIDIINPSGQKERIVFR